MSILVVTVVSLLLNYIHRNSIIPSPDLIHACRYHAWIKSCESLSWGSARATFQTCIPTVYSDSGRPLHCHRILLNSACRWLTTTSTVKLRKKVIILLRIQTPHIIYSSPCRMNIVYSVNDFDKLEVCFMPLLKKIIFNRYQLPHVIILLYLSRLFQ